MASDTLFTQNLISLVVIRGCCRGITYRAVFSKYFLCNTKITIQSLGIKLWIWHSYFCFSRRVRVVVSLVGKLVLPAVVGVYYAYLRNKHTLIEVFPTIVAYLTNGIAKSLASVQGKFCTLIILKKIYSSGKAHPSNIIYSKFTCSFSL